MKIAFVRTCIKTMLSKTSENFFDMFPMVGDAVGIDENVVKVDSHTHVKHIAKDIIHEALEGSRCISKSKRHDKPFKRTIVSAESSLPFIAFSNMNEVISVAEVDLGVDTSLARSIEEVRNERKGIAVFLGNAVQSSEVDTEAERTILFANKENWSTMWRRGGMDVTNCKMFISSSD